MPSPRVQQQPDDGDDDNASAASSLSSSSASSLSFGAAEAAAAAAAAANVSLIDGGGRGQRGQGRRQSRRGLGKERRNAGDEERLRRKTTRRVLGNRAKKEAALQASQEAAARIWNACESLKFVPPGTAAAAAATSQPSTLAALSDRKRSDRSLADSLGATATTTRDGANVEHQQLQQDKLYFGDPFGLSFKPPRSERTNAAAAATTTTTTAEERTTTTELNSTFNNRYTDTSRPLEANTASSSLQRSSNLRNNNNINARDVGFSFGMQMATITEVDVASPPASPSSAPPAAASSSAQQQQQPPLKQRRGFFSSNGRSNSKKNLSVITDISSPKVNLRQQGQHMKKQTNKKKDSPSTSSVFLGAGDAWMCGVCGKTYSTLATAEKHESAHIRQVVETLGFLRNDSSHNSHNSTRSGGGKSSSSSSNSKRRDRQGVTTNNNMTPQQQQQQQQQQHTDNRSDSLTLRNAKVPPQEMPQPLVTPSLAPTTNSTPTTGVRPHLPLTSAWSAARADNQHFLAVPKNATTPETPLSSSHHQVQTFHNNNDSRKEQPLAHATASMGTTPPPPPVGNSTEDAYSLSPGTLSTYSSLHSSSPPPTTKPLGLKPPYSEPHGLTRNNFRPRYVVGGDNDDNDDDNDEDEEEKREERPLDSPLVPVVETPQGKGRSNNSNNTRQHLQSSPSKKFSSLEEYMDDSELLVPKPRVRSNSEVRFDERVTTNTFHHHSNSNSSHRRAVSMMAGGEDGGDDTTTTNGGGDDEHYIRLGGAGYNNNSSHGQDDDMEEVVLLPSTMRDYVVLADEALLDVCNKALPMILTEQEMEAERELQLLARDKAYYNEIALRALARRRNPTNRYRSDKEDILGKIQNKLLDAYQLMKEGDGPNRLNDQYRKKKKGTDDNDAVIVHTDQTLYVNVMVKNSIQVVRNELERLAQKRWENIEEIEKYTRFERFRVYAHVNIVRLAGIAFASDFTPRRIAVQLSNDLYRLLTPRLKRRGVTIETEIEYRVGPYFVLAVNINTIHWGRLVKATYRDVMVRKAKWQEERRREEAEQQESEEKKKAWYRLWIDNFMRVFSLSQYDILAQIFAWFYHLHWIVYLPICWTSYYTFLGPAIRHFIISSVTDEIFFYVEEKGMEMEIEIRKAATQAAFMLSALREIRADGRELKKKRQATESEEKGSILGPLLGPAIKADKEPAVKPEGFELPGNLEYVGLELDLPVGFRRLRWALLHRDSKFTTDALMRVEARCDNITMGAWDKYDEYIGLPTLPDSVNPKDFEGAQKELSYLMPKSAFVKANMCYETQTIIAYNDYCFCLKKKTLTPEVPYGSTFVCWTQNLVVNTGGDTCKLYCSVEPEFPNGPPLISRQITSGMRAGTGEAFVSMGETITKYADEYP